MKFQTLVQSDLAPWASLLAVSFERKPNEMRRLLEWFHSLGLLAWGAWDGERLAAQYSCLLRYLHVPWSETPLLVGLSVNMAVHPDYRGRGLVKKLSRPVYAALREMGGVAGVGFSNAAGVKVDRRSKGYGYQIAGRMESRVIWLRRGEKTAVSLTLTDDYPHDNGAWQPSPSPLIQFEHTVKNGRFRFAHHPFRRYRFALWQESGQTMGIVVYRKNRFAAVSLLAAYAHDLPELLRHWAATMRQNGIAFVHLLTTPNAGLLTAVEQLGHIVHNRFSRSPYYLTIKPLIVNPPQQMGDFAAWDCNGGDIL